MKCDMANELARKEERMGALSFGNLFRPFTWLQAEERCDVAHSLVKRADGWQGEGLLQFVVRAHLFPGRPKRGLGRTLDMIRDSYLNVLKLQDGIKRIAPFRKEELGIHHFQHTT